MQPMPPTASKLDRRGGEFVAFRDFDRFQRTVSEGSREETLTSPEVATEIEWNELVPSWGVKTPTGSWIRVEVRAKLGDRWTNYFRMGDWSRDNTDERPRTSVGSQKREEGDVDTDTLRLASPATALQFRVTLGGADAASRPTLKLLTAALLNSRAEPADAPPNKAAWGVELDVPGL